MNLKKVIPMFGVAASAWMLSVASQATDLKTAPLNSEVKLKALYLHDLNFYPNSIMTSTQGKLVISRKWARKTYIYDPTKIESPLAESEGAYGDISISSDANGWVGICQGAGSELKVFNLAAPRKIWRFQFEFEFDCIDVAFEGNSSQTKLPKIWIANAARNSVVKVRLPQKFGTYRTQGFVASPRAEDLRAESFRFVLENELAGLKWPAAVEKVGSKLFTLNAVIGQAGPFPLVFDIDAKRELMGSEDVYMGYRSKILRLDQDSEDVALLHPGLKEIHVYNLAKPSNEPRQTIKLSATLEQPYDFSKYKNCVLVLDQKTKDASARWELLRLRGHQWQSLGILGENMKAQKELQGPRRQEITSDGHLFVSHWRGVTRVDGLFPKDLCH